jgi:uncharacterized protein YcbK (DUF882 family)
VSASSSPHFAAREFACPHCGVALVRPLLLSHLESLRAAVGRPMRIVSGYRCPVHNAAVGGAPNSQHMYAAAADLPHGLVPVALAQSHGFSGIGVSGQWAVHVDVRDGESVLWHY